MVLFRINNRIVFLLVFTLAYFGLSNSIFAQLYNSPGTFTYTVPTYSGPDPGPNEILELSIQVTIVGAGGGGGRGNGAGGGGGGQVITITRIVNEGDEFNGIVGTGGAGRTGSNGVGLAGSNSVFDGIFAAGGSGGGGGDAGNGGNSGNGNLGGIAAIPISGNAADSRNSGGGGGGAAEINGNGANGVWSGNNANGGNGGEGIDGFGGGGGGASKGQGNGNNGTGGQGFDGGTGGSRGVAIDATNGGGGGGGGNGGGRGGHGVVIITFQARILPVKYTSFQATFNPENRASDITWTTAKEWENSHFEIERAIGQVKDFDNIGTVEGMGFSDEPMDYAFSDKKLPLTGGVAYYRLKQVDFNGNFQFSEVLSVRIPSTQVQSGVWRAYPNPSKGQRLNLDLVNIQEYNNEPISVRIISPLAENFMIDGSNIRDVSDKLSEKIQSSTNGLYILEVYWGQKREYIKVLKN